MGNARSYWGTFPTSSWPNGSRRIAAGRNYVLLSHLRLYTYICRLKENVLNASEEVRFTFYSIVPCINGEYCILYFALFGHHLSTHSLQVDWKIIVIIQCSNKSRSGAGRLLLKKDAHYTCISFQKKMMFCNQLYLLALAREYLLEHSFIFVFLPTVYGLNDKDELEACP